MMICDFSHYLFIANKGKSRLLALQTVRRFNRTDGLLRTPYLWKILLCSLTDVVGTGKLTLWVSALKLIIFSHHFFTEHLCYYLKFVVISAKLANLHWSPHLTHKWRRAQNVYQIIFNRIPKICILPKVMIAILGKNSSFSISIWI